MIMPIKYWKNYGGIVPIKGVNFDFMICTEAIGEYNKDWFTDADKIYKCGIFILFYYKNKNGSCYAENTPQEVLGFRELFHDICHQSA